MSAVPGTDLPAFPRAFHEQARRVPDRVAVRCGDQVLTYRGLDRRSDALAAALRARGVGEEERVGILLDRSVDWPTAVLGIMKCGAAYVPLDRSWPEARLRAVAAEARLAVVVVADDAGEPSLPPAQVRTSLARACADAGWSSAPPGEPSALAYVIYTSGSTGTPKGVMVEHRSLANLVAALPRAVYSHLPEEGLRVGLNGPLSFDTSVKQLIQLAHGHSLVVVPEEARRDDAVLDAFLREAALDVIDCTPSLLEAWIADGPLDRLPRTLLVGGEAVPPSLWNRLRDRPDLSAFNLYGPTECTVDATTCPIAPPRPDPRIGTAIDGVRIRVLDGALDEVETGTPGEVAIAGACVARGYWNRPRATAERFVPDPGSSGGRMYLSGDRGLVLADGEARLLGRADRQVKVLGVRIEPAEVEAALTLHPQVRGALVMPRAGDGGTRLVGYVVPEGVAAPAPAFARSLRHWLRTLLPDAMVPADVVCVDAWPVTENGKVDTTALPPPPPEIGRWTREPASATERAIAGAWCEVLGRAAVGAEDSLFDLGGHSLTVGRIASRLRDRLGREVPLRWLFECETVASLAARLDESPVSLPALPRVARTAGTSAPVSFAQERVLFLQALAPGNAAYLCRSTVAIEGELDLERLGRALSAVVERHEILRTAFVREHGRWTQRVLPPWTVSLEPVDLSGGQDEGAAREIVAGLVREGFDVARPPLVRWTVLKLSARRHLLVWVAHHLVHDGWSSSVLLGEMCAVYASLVRGEDGGGLPPLPVQMADFCRWQREYVDSEEGRRQLARWSDHLWDIRAAADLPLDRSRPAAPRFRGAVLRTEIPADRVELVRTLARDSGATLFMALLAVFAVTIGRLTGEREVCIGTFVANRRRREVEPLIGMILNTLPVRVRLDGARDLGQLLAVVREELLGAYANQDVPFDALVAALRPERVAGRNPLFQVAFTSHTPPSGLELPGATVTVDDFLDNGSSKFDLNVVMVADRDGRSGVTLIWEYDTDLFEPTTVQAIAAAYAEIVASATAVPSVALASLRRATEGERRSIASWNQTAAAVPPQTVDVLFDLQAARTPDAVAVVGRDGARTYEQLRRSSNRLASYLRTRGAGPGAVVAVSARRTSRLPETLLAVLKTGACYLPLDAGQPAARLAGMLKDASAALAVTDGSTREALESCVAAVVDLDRDRAAIDECPDAREGRGAEPGDVAYVIYTSGSTGRPKGVAVFHRSLTNLLVSMSGPARLEASSHLFAVSNVAFDIAALEIFGPLVAGGTCWLASEHLGASAAAFAEMEDASPTVVQATPSGWRILLEAARLTPGATALVGGEALPPALSAALRSRLREVVNVYGPTETTIWSTVHRIAGDERISLGRPLANTRVHVLDARGDSGPLGAVGELAIGGIGVAMGYVGQGRVTAEAFVPDPDSRGERLYRTGDLVRQRPDGTLDFLGRRDHQVKLRGHRIELGEIEAALATLPEVGAATVVAHKAQDEDARLVAYLVPAPGTSAARPELADVRTRLRALVPEYMLVSAAVWLDALPLTPNGKVDRAALPAPPDRDPAAPPVAARTPVEDLLVSIWCEVLGRSEVGVDDDFFGLGGHSLAAMQMASRASEALGFDVPLHAVFGQPVLRDLAASLASCGPREVATSVAALLERASLDATAFVGPGSDPLPGEPR